MVVFVCEDSYDAILSAIYDAWVESVKIGYSNVGVMRSQDISPNLFDEYRETICDPQKVEKVVRTIKTKISEVAYLWTYNAAQSFEKDAPDAIFRFMILGFKVGENTTNMLTEPTVMRMLEITRRVGNEAHHFLEFARFTSVDGRVYVCHLEPKCNVIMRVTSHFTDRMPSENFIIIDDTRKLAGIHQKDGETYYRYLTDEEFERLSQTENYVDDFTEMWKVFFDTIAIEQRYNPKCQQTLLPQWKRKHMTEFK